MIVTSANVFVFVFYDKTPTKGSLLGDEHFPLFRTKCDYPWLLLKFPSVN